jgi:phosphate transport system permease protein
MTNHFPESSLTRSPSSPRTLFNTAMTVVAYICGVLALLPLVAVLSYVLFKGFSSLNLSVFTELPPAPLVMPFWERCSW